MESAIEKYKSESSLSQQNILPTIIDCNIKSPVPGNLIKQYIAPVTPNIRTRELLEDVCDSKVDVASDYDLIKQQLSEALVVINEQDRLIHQGI